MLTTIPYKDFIALTDSISEDGGEGKPFVWDEMLKHSSTVDDISEYVSTTNCKFVGSGSSRTAYFLPVGAHGKNVLNEPSCLKVAHNHRGPRQNRVEVSIIKKYSGPSMEKYTCFPKLYDWDGDNFYFMLCEVGTPVTSAGNAVSEYIRDLDRFLLERKPEASSGISERYRTSRGARFVKFALADFSNPLDEIDKAIYFINDMFGDVFREEFVSGLLDEILKRFPKYNGIVSTIRYVRAHRGDEINADDFLSSSNWGLVCRDGVTTMIPIDWGLSPQVSEKYY